MMVRSSLVLALAAALSGCGGQRAPDPSRHLPAAVATPPTDAPLLRISRNGGGAQLLQVSTLAPREWLMENGLPSIGHVLTVNRENQEVYATDASGRLIAIDLIAHRERQLDVNARQLFATPDGTIFGVDTARHPVRFINRSVTNYKAVVDRGAILMRGPGEDVLIAGNRPGLVELHSPDAEVRRYTLPAGRFATTWAGDLVAITTDTAVVILDPTIKTGAPAAKRKRTPAESSIRLAGTPTVAAFSPSGHRLYVGRQHGGVAVIDRYGRTLLREVAVPGAIDAIRVDRSGRWLLAHGGNSDSLWVIDLANSRVAATLVAPWADDLPQVMGGISLLLRRKGDLVAFDLSVPEPIEKGALVNGASDLYIMLPPTLKPSVLLGQAPAPRPTPRPMDSATPVTGLPASSPAAAAPADHATPPPAARPPGTAASTGGTVYLQVSSSQNQDWAQAFAKQLKDGGFPTKVLAPSTGEDSYRVMVGPYQSREEAESVGKRLGRSYFIVSNPGGTT
jgi:cell division septation protein DedD